MNQRSSRQLFQGIALALTAFICAADTTSAEPLYAIEELPTLGGSSSLAFGINAKGAVVGQAALSDGNQPGRLSGENGAITNLGTLGGDRSQAFAINDQGFVTGRARNADGARSCLYLGPWHK